MQINLFYMTRLPEYFYKIPKVAKEKKNKTTKFAL